MDLILQRDHHRPWTRFSIRMSTDPATLEKGFPTGRV